MAPRVLAYLRQSDTSGAGRDSLSLDSQRAELERAASERGWTITGIITDPDEKGWDDTRPGLLELYQRCRAGEAEIVAVWKLDRLARSLRIQETVLHELSRIGVEVWSHQEPWVAQPLFRQIIGAVNEEQTRIISANVRRALHERQRRGLMQGRPPLGYVRADKTSPLTIDPDAAAIVRDMFAQRASGIGPAAIARDLTARGIRTPDGHIWSAGTVMRTLGHVTYRGALQTGDEVREACHEPIVGTALWQAAQQRSGTRRAVRQKTASSWLEGLVEHGCGMPMYLIGPYRSRPYAEMRCRVAGSGMLHAAQTACPISPRSLRLGRAESLVWEAVLVALDTLLRPAAAVARARRAYRDLVPVSVAAHREATERKSRAVARRSRAEDLYLSGSRDRAWFDAEDTLVAHELAAADLVLAAVPAPPDADAIESIWTTLHAMRDLAAIVAPEDRGDILRALGTAIITTAGYHLPRGSSGDAGKATIRVHAPLRGFFPDSDT